jgi:hypothetical protein
MATYNLKSSKETFKPFAKCKLSAMMPTIILVSKQNELNPNRPHAMRVAVREITNCVKYN